MPVRSRPEDLLLEAISAVETIVDTSQEQNPIVATVALQIDIRRKFAKIRTVQLKQKDAMRRVFDCLPGDGNEPAMEVVLDAQSDIAYLQGLIVALGDVMGKLQLGSSIEDATVLAESNALMLSIDAMGFQARSNCEIRL